MKYALQLYGVFRTFDVCLPNILNYIMFDRCDYDVFILSQKDDGYSPANERAIRELLGHKCCVFKYIDDYPEGIRHQEDLLCRHYDDCVTDAKKNIQNDLVTNGFVTRLWYRRWLNNQMRIEYQQANHVTYDWVIRTRFDIGYRTITNQSKLCLLNQPPELDKIYLFPDTFSCGSPAAIDYESNLIKQWPYIYNVYGERDRLLDISNNYNTIRKWMFMSEMNLTQYLRSSKFKIDQLPHDLMIIRRDTINSAQDNDIKSDHIASVYYGCNHTWINVTNQFIELFSDQYDNRDEVSTIVVKNSITQTNTDPAPHSVKNLVITTVEGHEYVYRECSTIRFKYQYYYVLSNILREIKKVTYGLGREHINDITKRFMNYLKNTKKIIFVTNDFAGCDPAPGEMKSISIELKDGTIYEFQEYSIVELIGGNSFPIPLLPPRE